jgi:diguanylate cyclase (GGDEF)-like protein
MNVYSLLTILEVLCINTYTIYKCAKRRGTKAATLLSLCAVTAVVAAAAMALEVLAPENGSGLFMLAGFVYVLPLFFLFAQPKKHLIIVLSSSWIYTMFGFSFSFRIGSLLPAEDAGLSVLIVQTLFFALTLSYYIKFVNNIFVNIIKYIDKRMTDFLLAISLSWFFIIFLANWVLTADRSYSLEFILLLLIIVNVILTYRLFYRLVSVNFRAKELSHITKIDTLTQLKNREGFYEDVQQKISLGQCFSVVFADLDNFKSVNDKFGHDAGDRYLQEFVRSAKQNLNSGEGFYRLHGDEFVFLVDSRDVEGFGRALEKLRFKQSNMVFKGLSTGYSSFPKDGGTLSELLHVADLRMYQRKKEKHRFSDVRFAGVK